MNWKRFTQNFVSRQADECGFTIMELMVASSMGLLILGLLMTSTISSKNLYRMDAVRTRINQDLRGTMDIIGSQVRVAGENFASTFPAILVANSVNGTSDTITLRRNLLDEVLKVCAPLSAGSSTALYLATGTEPGCSFSDNTHNFTTWHDYRESLGGQVPAYIYNTGTKLGEFFVYGDDEATGTEYSISRTGGTWTNEYDVDASAAYMIQEWRFQLIDETLQMVVNNDDANPLNVAFGISDLQVVIVKNDDTEVNTFGVNDDWSDIKAVRIQLVGTDSFKGEEVNRTLTTQFFPRNVLSN